MTGRRHVLLSRSLTLLLFASSAVAQRDGLGIDRPTSRATVRIDATSERAFRRSVDRIRQTLRPLDQQRFDLVLEVVESMIPSREKFLEEFHRKTAGDVLAVAGMVLREFDADRDGQLDKSEVMNMRANLARARMSANESAAIAALKMFALAQEQAREEGLVDVDGDGRGEYAYLAELTGARGVRGESGARSRPSARKPYLASSWRVINGRASRQGYLFQVWLPDARSLAVPEASRGGVGKSAPDPETASGAWCAYAWPVEYDGTGRRAFCITQDGDVLVTDNARQRYSGHQRPPGPYAAFVRGMRHLGPVRLHPKKRCNDGTRWQPYQ